MSKVYLLLVFSLVSLANVCFSQNEDNQSMTHSESTKNPIVLMKTSMGDVKIELYADKAPKTVANFLQYVKNDFYSQTIFHRVIKGFMIQGGGFSKDMSQKPTLAPVVNEAENGLKNTRGTLAMARTSDVNSATAQFFINTVDNSFLNFRDKSPSGYGYCVFGKVIEGMDVMDRIEKSKTATKGMHQDVPVEAVEILSVTEVKA